MPPDITFESPLTVDPSKGAWTGPKMFPKQVEVFCCRARALLCSGPRLSGKTRAVLHRVVRHLWETDGARVGMFARTLKSSKDGGSWSLLHRPKTGILAEWFDARIGCYYTSEVNGVPGVKVDGITRTPGFKIRNKFGGESEMLLFSLDNDDDVEAKLKELEFSMIYFSELDKFGDRRVVTVALASLRMGHLTYEQQQWIADCNPAEEGDLSWIYRLFFLERNMTYAEYRAHQAKEELPVLPQEDFTAFYGSLQVIEILPEHNVFVDPRQLQEVRVACGADAGLFARHVLGKWIWGGGDRSRHFRQAFNKARHVVGDASATNEDEWIVILPTSNCFELVTGWDLGDTRHAAAIMEKTLNASGQGCFALLDELVIIGEECSNEAFTEEFMLKIKALEDLVGRMLDLTRAWSDRSSIERYSATGDTYPYKQVYAASKERIFLQGAQKPRPRVRVKLMKELLAADRFKVSAHCVHAIEMFRDLKKGAHEEDYVVADKNKHIFDAITYALLMELAEELEIDSRNQAGHRPLIIHVR